MNRNNNSIIRIQKVELTNFKNVEHGSITFNCGKKHTPWGTEPDILGIYGQNGSGKTAFIDSLIIVKAILSGEIIPASYCNCVTNGKDYAEINYTFECQTRDGELRNYNYKCRLRNTSNDVDSEASDMLVVSNEDKKSDAIEVYDEKLSFSGMFKGKKYNLQAIIDTSTKDIPFGPEMKLKALCDSSEYTSIVTFLNVEKKLASEQSQSFIFKKKIRTLFKESEDWPGNIYYHVINDLYTFAKEYLFILDTKFTGEIRLNSSFPIFTSSGYVKLNAEGPSDVAEQFLPTLSKIIDNMNLAISNLIPSMEISLEEIGSKMMPDGRIAKVVELVSRRNGKVLPLRYESDGIRKIVSCMQLLITAHNNPSVTVAIDEFDSGVFEYLLGEILIIMEETGVGQFIFTSHNLRPLEVINKKYLYFTTTNPQNRYIHLKNIGNSNNLRDVYYREIIIGSQDEELYSETKRYRIAAAFRKAGEALERI